MFKGLSLQQAPPVNIPFRFFFTAPFFGLLAGQLILTMGSELFDNRWRTELIALTHLFTLGWMTIIMMGAYYQMIPVMVGGSVPYLKLARLVHFFLSAGTLSFIIGLLYFSKLNLFVAIAFLTLSAVLFLMQMTKALLGISSNRPTLLAMRISLFSFLMTLLLGIYLIGGHAQLWSFPDNRMQITGAHLTFALLGWIGQLILGVSFHIIPMFYMTKDFSAKKAYFITLSLFSSTIIIPFSLWSENKWLVLVASLPALLSFSLYLFELMRLIQARKRKTNDVTLILWKTSLLALLLSLLTYAFSFFSQMISLPILAPLLFIVGFALFTTNAMLYKIIPFLVWFHRFGHLIGIVPVPLMKDIMPRRNAKIQIIINIFFLLFLTLGNMFSQNLMIKLSGGLLMLSSLLLLYNLFCINKHKPLTDRSE